MRTSSFNAHRIIAKDHFDLLLNEAAGLVARVIVRHTVQIVVKAWDDTSIPIEQAIAQVLPIFHHPSASAEYTVTDAHSVRRQSLADPVADDGDAEELDRQSP